MPSSFGRSRPGAPERARAPGRSAPQPAGTADSSLAVTRTKRSLLGLKATGNLSFVAQLLKGVSPSLATVESVRAWMDANADAAERRPPALAGTALPARGPGFRNGTLGPARRRRTIHGHARGGGSARAGPTTLVRYRITGKGPCRYRFVTMFATIVLVLLIGVLA